jgi:hypothetical protein
MVSIACKPDIAQVKENHYLFFINGNKGEYHQPQPIVTSLMKYLKQHPSNDFCLHAFVFDFDKQPSAFSAD